MRQEIVAVIKRDIPHIHERDLRWFDDGWDHVVVVVNNQIVYRFLRLKEYEAKIPVEAAFTDVFSLMSPIAIPRLQQRHDAATHMTFTPYHYIRGTRLTRDLFVSFRRDEQVNIAKQLGSFLTALHSFPVLRAKESG